MTYVYMIIEAKDTQNNTKETQNDHLEIQIDSQHNHLEIYDDCEDKNYFEEDKTKKHKNGYRMGLCQVVDVCLFQSGGLISEGLWAPSPYVPSTISHIYRLVQFP